MIGRGTRLDPASEKLMFWVYDYTDATRLFGEEFKGKFRPPRVPRVGEPPEPPEPPERTLQVEGFEVRVTDAGRYIVICEDGRAVPVTVEEYKQRLAPRTRPDRADAFTYKHASWLSELPRPTEATLKALAGQFARAGTESVENPQVFQMPDVLRAGGLPALKILGEPSEVLSETKERLFAA